MSDINEKSTCKDKEKFMIKKSKFMKKLFIEYLKERDLRISKVKNQLKY